jgi:hypothetical protein
MKLFTLRLTTLKSKLYAIVFVSFIVRVVAFFALPNSASNLAPDEGQYANLVSWVAQGKAVDQYPSFGPNLYNSSRSIILPAALFNRLGIGALDSIRLTSTIYSLLTTILIAVLIIKLNEKRQIFTDPMQRNQTIILSLFLLFTFLPSRFAWSLLGLRESSVEFWIIFVFIGVFTTHFLEVKLSISNTITLLIGIVMVYNSRPQVGLVLGVGLFLFFISFCYDLRSSFF